MASVFLFLCLGLGPQLSWSQEQAPQHYRYHPYHQPFYKLHHSENRRHQRTLHHQQQASPQLFNVKNTDSSRHFSSPSYRFYPKPAQRKHRQWRGFQTHPNARGMVRSRHLAPTRFNNHRETRKIVNAPLKLSENSVSGDLRKYPSNDNNDSKKISRTADNFAIDSSIVGTKIKPPFQKLQNPPGFKNKYEIKPHSAEKLANSYALIAEKPAGFSINRNANSIQAAPSFIIKQAGPSQQFGWVGHGTYAPLDIPNIFRAAGLNTQWIPGVDKVFKAGLTYPQAPTNYAQDKLRIVEPVQEAAAVLPYSYSPTSFAAKPQNYQEYKPVTVPQELPKLAHEPTIQAYESPAPAPPYEPFREVSTTVPEVPYESFREASSTRPTIRYPETRKPIISYTSSDPTLNSFPDPDSFFISSSFDNSLTSSSSPFSESSNTYTSNPPPAFVISTVSTVASSYTDSTTTVSKPSKSTLPPSSKTYPGNSSPNLFKVAEPFTAFKTNWESSKKTELHSTARPVPVYYPTTTTKSTSAVFSSQTYQTPTNGEIIVQKSHQAYPTTLNQSSSTKAALTTTTRSTTTKTTTASYWSSTATSIGVSPSLSYSYSTPSVTVIPYGSPSTQSDTISPSVSSVYSYPSSAANVFIGSSTPSSVFNFDSASPSPSTFIRDQYVEQPAFDPNIGYSKPSKPFTAFVDSSSISTSTSNFSAASTSSLFEEENQDNAFGNAENSPIVGIIEFEDQNENNYQQTFQPNEEIDENEVVYIFYENEDNPQSTIESDLELQRLVNEGTEAENNLFDDSFFSASVPQGEIFNDQNSVPVFSFTGEQTAPELPIFYDVPIKIEETGEGFDPPTEIRTFYVPYENAINIPDSYDVNIGTSFGYTDEDAQPSFATTNKHIVDNEISSFDVSPGISSENQEIVASLESPNKQNVRRVRRKKQRTSRSRSFDGDYVFRPSIPFGTRLGPRDLYTPIRR